MSTITVPRAVLEQALAALEEFGTHYEHCPRYPTWARPELQPICNCGLDSNVAALRAALAQPVPHGCHVYLHHGMKPDGCVLDENRPENCIYAKRLLREGKDKTACVYWQPIEVTR